MNVKTYKNILEAHTAFVLDRYNFLANLQTAIHKETHVESLALFDIIKEGNFVELITGLMEDPDARNREQALYTLANLLALENQEALVQRTKKALLERIVTVATNLFEPATPVIQKTCAYVYRNLAMVLAKRGWKDLDKDEDGMVRGFCNRVLDAFNGLYGSAPLVSNVSSKAARSDLLYAAARVSRVRPFGPRLSRVLAEMLGSTGACTKALLDMLNNRLSEADGPEKFIPAEYHGEVLDRFLLVLTNDKLSEQTHMEALWGLSNFVVEPDVANQVEAYDELLDAVLNYAFTHGGATRTNAIWVLANMISKVTEEDVQYELSLNCAIRTALMNAVSDDDILGDSTAVKVAKEGLALLDKWVELFSDEEELEELEELEGAHVTKEEAEAFDAAILQQEGRPVILSHPPVELPVEHVPTALDLMLEGRTPPSAVVRGLVNQVRAAGVGNWVAIPDNTVLMIEDITTLQMMGYVIQRGYIGVNPLLMNSI